MIEIIPAIDMIDGKCVRLTRGDYNTKKVYNENPAEIARQFEDAGIKRLHVVDLDGAKAKHIVNHKTLEQIATQTNLKIDFGGGLKSDEDVKIAFECGAWQVTGGSIAAKEPEVFLKWVEKYGADRMILGADVKKIDKNGLDEYNISVSGWQEESKWELFEFLDFYAKKGLQYVISTDISKDGLLQGAALDLYDLIDNKHPEFKLIASGGITTIDEVGKLNNSGIYGVIIGKAIYEGRISLAELQKYVA